MAIYPGAVVRLLPQNATETPIRPRKVVHHTAIDGVGPTLTLSGWFSSPGAQGCESHFWVRWDGTVEQYIDTERQADAQWDANVDAISIETEDDRANGAPANPWSAEQVAALIALDRWLCATHGIPAVLCPSATGAGLGWHNQYYEWSRDGHDCPGQPRVDQLVNTIIPAVAGQPAEDDVTPADIEAIAQRVTAYLANPAVNPGTVIDPGARSAIASVQTAVVDPVTGVRALLTAQGTATVDASTVAASIADALGADLARKVADELNRRLAA